MSWLLELACKLQADGVLRSSCACKSGESRPTKLCSHTLRLHRLVLHVRLAIGLVYPGARRTFFPPVLLLTTSGASQHRRACPQRLRGRSFFRKLLLLLLSGGRASVVIPACMSCFCATRARANGLPSRVESRHRPPLLTAKFINMINNIFLRSRSTPCCEKNSDPHRALSAS